MNLEAGSEGCDLCGMTVEVASANYKSEHEGHAYYFCCGGCKQKLDKDPTK
ncbi:MAG: YHS domain-containing protein [Candidatus Acidiferrales bacterium]